MTRRSSSGRMFEHLGKAYLASLHFTLLLEKQYDFVALLRLAGHGDRAKPGHVLKTVGMYEALNRIDIIRGTGNDFTKRFEPVLRARNGVAHIGDAGDVADEIAQLAVQGAHELMEMLARPLSELFGDYTAAAEALRNDHATKVQQLVALLIARAKHAFSDRYVDPDARERGRSWPRSTG